MNKLSEKLNMNPKRQKFKAWLEQKVELPQFYDLFIENAIEDLSTVQSLTKEELKEIGIDKIGHLKKIMSCIAELDRHNDEGKGTTATTYLH